MGTTHDINGSAEILERNLAALAKQSPEAARAIRAAIPAQGVEFVETRDGSLGAVYRGRALCSKRRPLDEAESWSGAVDAHETGFIGTVGFGMGYHLGALARAHLGKSLVVCCETDVPLVRAVLERVDHSAWMGECPFRLLTVTNDRPALTELLKGTEALMATGTRIVEHAPSSARLGEETKWFGPLLVDVIRSMRTHMVTVLAQAGVTMRNFVMNLDHYTSCSGITPLKDSCRGVPAILVAAGPSLRRNIALLEDPRVREGAVIIAVQTMLKPLLERGIKPHFVTALDHHEISKRFYEGLTREDVEGVRLVAEAKANPMILDSFPGEIVCPQEKMLDQILGERLVRDMGGIKAGSTVAHLNYYLARHLGCSEIVLIGQDLGFSDGMYYAPGAAIHNVWAGELSEHRSLELMEFERIMRMRRATTKRIDVHGRPLFVDEQMSTYLAQFESEFARDTREHGVRVIDATEGGSRIAHTEVMTLREALDSCLSSARVALPDTAAHRRDDEGYRAGVLKRLRKVGGQLAQISEHSRKTAELIDEASALRGDPGAINRVVKKIHSVRDRVMELEPGLSMAMFINQNGGLNRFKSDREIALLKDLTPEERQLRQLERDKENVELVQGAAEHCKTVLDRFVDSVTSGGSKMVNFESGPVNEETDETTTEAGVVVGSGPSRVEAMIFVDPDIGGLGTARDLREPVFGGRTSLELTLDRLGSCANLDGVTIVTTDENAVRSVIGSREARVVGCDRARWRARAASIGKARSASRSCWRGSVGNLAAADEGFDPVSAARVMDEHGIDAAIVIGADWSLVDPALTDKAAAQFKHDAEDNPVVFSQAVPGLTGFLVARPVVSMMAQMAMGGSALGSIGSLLAYNPREPRSDQIATSRCLTIDPKLRDAGVRVVADSAEGRRAVARAWSLLGDRGASASSVLFIDEVAHDIRAAQRVGPGRIELELCTGRLTSGIWGQINHGRQEVSERPLVTINQAHTLVSEALELRGDCSLLLAGAGDPLMRRDALDFVSLADELGVSCVELRTDLLSEHHEPGAIVESGLGVLSVDVLADSAFAYSAMTGIDRYEALLDRMQSVFDARDTACAEMPTPWVLPRMTKCDVTVDEMQNFTDRWLQVCGCVAIDALPSARPGERIDPLPVPAWRARQMESDVLRVRCDGSVVGPNGRVLDEIDVFEVGVEQAMRAVRRAEDEPIVEPKARVAVPTSDEAA